MQLWDIVDKENGVNKVYYRNAVGAIVVTSTKSEESLNNAKKWK